LAAQAVSKANNRIKVCFIELIVTNCKHPHAKLQTRGGGIVLAHVATALIAPRRAALATPPATRPAWRR